MKALKIALTFAAGAACFVLLHLAMTASAAEVPSPSHAITSSVLSITENYGGNFRFPIYEPNTLDPADESSEGAIIGQLFEGLTKWGDDRSVVPGIAESWDSSDARTWTFYIRPGARFHNGRQITAQDVVYSWQRVAESGNESYGWMVAPLISTTVAVEDDILEVTLNQPYAIFPKLLPLPFMSVVPSETVSTIATNPVGSGPFQFQSWAPGERIVLTRYDDYYAGRPYLDRITFRFYDDQMQMYDDYAAGNLELSPVPNERLGEITGDPNAIFVEQLGTYYYAMRANMPPFDDVRVRQALNYAVDKQAVVDRVLGGVPPVADGPVPSGMPGYDPPVPAYDYNPIQALELLAQAGWMDTNGDGFLDDGRGADLTIELWYNTSPGHEAVTNAVADDFRDIGGSGMGARVVVNHTDWPDYMDNLDQYPMYRLGWVADFPDPYNFLYSLFGTDSPANRVGYSNSQVDAWLAQSQETVDQAARHALYESAEMQIQNDAPFINLYYFTLVYAKGEDVQGLVIPYNHYIGLGTIPLDARTD